ncbi:MAG TPA: uroporphyrinogen-III C-methyltransferase [Burkholderiales bacterium]|nr:uroporphyrinogen-III C-methyltransferase [Burkholderiales bacterium]
MSRTSKVFIVGAGPGDIELLTLKAVRAIGAADVILIDDLVNPAALKFAKENARVIEVGKRGGCRSTPQAFIEKMMVKFAEEGNIVVRLKGGDPFVFGRGGEEMLSLRAAGVAYEIVPGLTAGIGALSAIEIPVTHRNVSHGVSFITGHLRDGGMPNWHALAQSGTTLVIYMGVSNLSGIVSGLLQGGLTPDTPAAAVQSGTLPTQRSVVSTLEHLEGDIALAGIASPAVLVFGNVVNLACIAAEAEALRNAA